MTSVPSVKSDLAVTLTFLRALDRATEAPVRAAEIETGITGLSKAMVARGTVDAILMAVEREPAAPTPAPEAARRRFDLEDAAEPCLDLGLAGEIPARPEILARLAGAGNGGPDSNPDLNSASEARLTADAAMRDTAAARETSSPAAMKTRDPPVVDPTRVAGGDLGQTGAIAREQAGHLGARARQTGRARSRPVSCPRCGETQSAQPCACAPSRRRLFPFF